MTAARKCCGLEPSVDVASKETELKRVAYAVAVVCSKCGRRLDFRHVALFIVPEADYEAGVRRAAILRWNAATEAGR